MGAFILPDCLIGIHANITLFLQMQEYLLGSLSGDLKLPPQSYTDLFKICLATTKSHVHNVLAKLELQRRGQVSLWARDNPRV